MAFATAPPDWLDGADTDRPFHEAAARMVGVQLDHVVWSDPDAPWAGYDLVVVRSTWDYLDHFAAFCSWLRQVGALCTLHNPEPVVRWNLDKRYLVDLADVGVPVIATKVCSSPDDVEAALDQEGGQVVVKPATSAGSRRTGRFAPGDPGARLLAARILAEGQEVLVQPAVESVAAEGEVAHVLFGGEISHAVRKGPLLALGGGLIGGTYTEHAVPEELTPARRAVVEATSSAVDRLVAERFGVDRPLLYARVDLVTLADGTEAVLEVELAEPTFFLGSAPDAAQRFARLVADRAARG